MEKFDKVLFISNGITDVKTGVSGGETRFLETAKVWQKKGYEIHLLTTEGGHYLADKFNLPHVFHKSYDHKNLSRFSLFKKIFNVFFLYPKIKQLEKCVVYSTNDLILDVIPAFIFKIFKKEKIKWVATIHWLPPFPPWKRKQAPLINSIFFFISQRISLFLSQKKADILLPISESTRQQLLDSNVKHPFIYVGKCGVNYKKILKTGKSIIKKQYDAIFMKRFQAVKGIYDLIEIWKKIVKKNKKARLLLIGDGPAENDIKKIINQAKLNKNIKFAGVVYDFARKIKLLKQSKIFVLPSYEENWAIVIGEAMAAGLPVIVYDLPELRKVWGKNINYIKLKNTNDFADKIFQILNDKRQYQKEAAQNQKFVAKFDWDKIISQEIDFIISSHKKDRKIS